MLREDARKKEFRTVEEKELEITHASEVRSV